MRTIQIEKNDKISILKSFLENIKQNIVKKDKIYKKINKFSFGKSKTDAIHIKLNNKTKFCERLSIEIIDVFLLL